MEDKLKRKYINKRVNAKAEGIGFNLSFDEFKDLANEAGITHEQMNITGYHLARNNDTGPYKKGNCRFVRAIENIHAKKISAKMRDASKANIIKCNQAATTEKRHKARLKGVSTWKESFKKLSEEEKAFRVRPLDKEEIKRRHEILKTIPQGWGYLVRASLVIGLRPQVIGRFLNKYPIQ